MTNERLRGAIIESDLNHVSFSEALQVDPKTVERWITTARVPHRRHRMAAAALLGKTEPYLWPSTDVDSRTQSASRGEFVDLYPNRGSVPTALWGAMLNEATESIDLLAFAASFLHDSVPGFAETLATRARAGVKVRLLFGHPDSAAVALRGAEEGLGDLMAARCHLTWRYLSTVMAEPGVQARQHSTTLYASIFRFDDTLLANPHAYGAPASHSPVLHLNRIPSGRLYMHYLESFDRVWDSADTV